jgi:hypothetical protein
VVVDGRPNGRSDWGVIVAEHVAGDCETAAARDEVGDVELRYFHLLLSSFFSHLSIVPLLSCWLYLSPHRGGIVSENRINWLKRPIGSPVTTCAPTFWKEEVDS